MDFVGLLTSVSFWTSVAIIMALIYQWWKKPHPNFPPLIRGIPGLGVIPYLDNYPEKIFKKWSLEMKEPVIAVRMVNENAVIINTYEAAVQILSKQSLKSASRPSIFVYSQAAPNHGIIFRGLDETFKVLKSFALQNLKTGFGAGDSRDAMESVINEETKHLITELTKHIGKPIDIKAYVYRYTLNVISKVVSGKHFQYDDPTLNMLFKRISYLISESEDAEKIVHLNLISSLRYFPSYRRVFEKTKSYTELLISEFIQPLIDEHKANFNPKQINDLIDEFLLAQLKDKEHFTNTELVCMVRDFFMAGTDTIACSTAWLILCYLRYPQYQEKLLEEIDEILDDSDVVPSLERLKKEMPFTFAYLSEVTRYRSTVSTIYRRCAETIKYGDYVIPKGTMLLPNLLGIHRDPDTWQDPEKFDPFRHIDKDGEFIASNKIMPFGMGYRLCPGESLARREVFFIFVKLLQGFRLTAKIESLPSLDVGYNSLIHSPHPYMIVLSPRLLEE